MALGKFCFTLFPLLCAMACQADSQPRIVDLKAADGTLLKASYFAAAQPGPGVLLLHQCNQQRKLWDPLAQALNAVGISVLTLDYRGFGESGGPRFDKLSPDDENKVTKEVWPGDIDVAYQYLLSQSGVQRDKIGAGGASCGVDNSIQLARRHPEIKVLVLLAGATDHDGRQFLQKPGLPIFTGAADDDSFADFTFIMQWYYSLSPNPASRSQRYATGGHGAEIFASHPEFPTLIARWFQATLKDQPSALPETNGASLPSPQLQALKLIDEPNGAVKVDPKAAHLPEAVVNLLGYEHMLSGDTKNAIEIMKLNTVAYPDSPNAYDSLGDAYMADGQKDLARSSARRAVELLGSDTKDDEQRKKNIKENAEKKLQ